MRILDNVKPSSQEPFIKALLVGHSGSGKKTGAMTVGTSARKLHIDLENRAGSLYGVPNLEIISIPASAEESAAPLMALRKLKDELWALARSKTERFPYDSISVGGTSGLNRICMAFSLTLQVQDGNTTRPLARGPGETPSQPHYNPAMVALERWIFGMLPLPCHFILSCHMELRDEKIKGTRSETVGEPRWLPRTMGISQRAEFPAWFNETYRCFKQFDNTLGRSRYFWDTEGGYEYDFFKSSFNSAYGRLWRSPLEIDLGTGSPQGFEWILNQLTSRTHTAEEEKKGGVEPIEE